MYNHCVPVSADGAQMPGVPSSSMKDSGLWEESQIQYCSFCDTVAHILYCFTIQALLYVLV